MSRKLLGAISAFAISALLSGTVSAQVAGSISGEYSNLSGSGGVNVDSWGGNGTLQFPVSGMFGLQADTSYHNLSGNGYTTGLWQIGGAGGFTGTNWRGGVDVRYYDFSQDGTAHYTTYGGGVEFYPQQSWTLGVNGGWISGTEHGSYVGGMVKYYPCPRFVASGAIDYTTFGSNDNQTAYGVKAEYAPFDTTPATIYAGYSYLSYPGSDHANLYTVGIKFYVDNTNPGGTVDITHLQRQGEYGWIVDGPGALGAVY